MAHGPPISLSMTAAQTPSFEIDLNADLGEERGDDLAMLDIVTTANIAAGGHAGGGVVLSETVQAAVARGVNVGAHVSYPDREHFGRRSLLESIQESELTEALVKQITAVSDAATTAGATLTHVKAHGALYNDSCAEEAAAEILLQAVLAAASRCGRLLPVMGMPSSILEQRALHLGVPFIAEAFADRTYASRSALLSRDIAGAVKTETPDVVQQALNLAISQSIVLADGRTENLSAVTLCLHGDTEGAVEHAHAVSTALKHAGVVISGALVREAL